MIRLMSRWGDRLLGALVPQLRANADGSDCPLDGQVRCWYCWAGDQYCCTWSCERTIDGLCICQRECNTDCSCC